jgi:hypothetical protein
VLADSNQPSFSAHTAMCRVTTRSKAFLLKKVRLGSNTCLNDSKSSAGVLLLRMCRLTNCASNGWECVPELDCVLRR